MKICFLATASSIHTQRCVRYFVNRGDEVHVISPGPFEEGIIGGAKLYPPNRFPLRLGFLSAAINLVQGVIQVRKLLKKIKPDILHAYYITDSGLWATLSGFHPCIIRAMGSDIFIVPKLYPFFRKVNEYVLRKADLVICDSEVLKKGILEQGCEEGKIRIISDGVDTQDLGPQKRDKGFKQSLGIAGAPAVISIRGLKPVYNVEMLIRAIPLILKEVPEARFIIGGEGYQKDYLQGLANSLGISGSTKFTGWIQHDDIPKYLASSDVYVSTSLSDSNSIALQEALASELAPVVTDIPGNREIINDGESGFIVPIGDYEMLAMRIVCLLKDKELRDRFGKASRELIRKKFEHQREMGKIELIYRELLGK